jgi:membrane protease YdiL (CAAX protease family)
MSIPIDFPSQESDEPVYRSIHHAVPLKLGSLDVTRFIPPALPSVDVEAVRQPLTPGMPALRHIPLPSPEAYRLVVVPLEGATSSQPSHPAGVSPTHPSFTPSERVRFPVAEPPTFKHLKPAPTVVEPVPAPPPVSAPAAAAPAAAPIPSPVSLPEPAPATSPLAGRIDPFFALLVYLALGLGTWVIGDLESRYTILWVTLIAIGGSLMLIESGQPRGRFELGNVIWGIIFGFLIGLPLLVFAPQGLATTSILLFPSVSLPALFQMMTITGPLGETLFFRGNLQERHGIAASIIGAGLGTLILFLPVGMGTSSLLAIGGISLFMTLLAGIYSYIRERHGLAASYACQVTINLMLFFLPRLLAPPVP